MKKLVLAVALLFGASSIFAQDLVSKKGEKYLPEAGDWAIGIDAVPLLDYVGNIFGKTADNTHAGNIWTPNTPGFSVSGKYFIKDNMAFRGGLRLGINSNSKTNMVADRANVPATSPWPDAAPEVANKMKQSDVNVGLNFGVEWRKGKTRLQGYYGGEFGFMIGSSSTKYEYGNALKVGSVGVDAADDFGGNLGTTVDGQGNVQASRMLKDKGGVTFGLGLRGFVGAEYFIIPKLSIGGEFGWGLGVAFTGKSSTSAEAIGFKNGATAQTVETLDRNTGKSSRIGVDNDIVNPLFGAIGRLNLTFHF